MRVLFQESTENVFLIKGLDVLKFDVFFEVYGKFLKNQFYVFFFNEFFSHVLTIR